MRKLIVLGFLIALFAAACSSSAEISGEDPLGDDDPDASGDPGQPGDVEPGDVEVPLEDLELTAALVPFDACSSFLEYVHAEAMERVGPYGLDGFGPYGPIMMEGEMAVDDEAAAEAPAEESAGDAAAEPSNATDGDTGGLGGVDFSETNVQEEGVDEPDIVKTDGNRIVTISDNTITVVDVTGAPETAGTIHLGSGWAREAFLAGDQLVVISDGDGGFVPLAADGDAEANLVEGDAARLPSWTETTVVTTVDLSGDPQVIEMVEMEGRYLSGRAVDGTARVVLSARPNQLPFLYPQNEAGEERATQANREIVAESTIDQWVPDYQRRNAGGTVLDEGQLVPCERMHRPEVFGGFDMLTVVGFDLGSTDAVPTDATAVLAAGETVYASTTSLYVATNRWFDPIVFESRTDPAIEESYSTSLHKFAFTDDGASEYQASGSVGGHLLNQFSMDEFDGRLRVATTKGSPWGSGPESESFLTVFEQNGGTLDAVGSVGGLGRGERIFSVRFLDDVAYVVTFRQVDPFYVVDLSSPTEPAVVGELKIPGYSSYLHPIGDDLVLGVGQDADESGMTRGAKVSLFDVSDLANPVELAVWTGGSNSYTDAEWDHRAFTWWAPEDLAVLPLSSWSDQFFGAVVLEVTPDGIVERGRIDQADESDTTGRTECLEIQPADPAGSFDEARTELDYVLLEGGKIVACDPDLPQNNPVEGFFCEGPIGLDEVGEWYGIDLDDIAGTLAEPIPDGSLLHVCWPDNYGGDPVVRSLVVGDDLWTMSYRWLQANDLATLDRGPRIPIT